MYISLIIPLVRSDTCDCDQINLNIEELLRANDDLTMRLDILESVRSSINSPIYNESSLQWFGEKSFWCFS